MGYINPLPLPTTIWNLVNDVRDKYADFDRMTYKFKNEYLPLADDEKIAMNFLKKAYVISSEAEKYILDNYKN